VRRIAPLLLAIAAFLAVTVVWIVTDRRASERVYDEYSAANTSDSGLSQAAVYLAQRGKSEMLTRALGRVPIEKNAVVFRVADALPVFFDPEDLEGEQFGPPRPKERPLLNEHEEAFVRGGGRMVIAAHIGALPVRTPAETTAEKVFPIWPGVDVLDVPEESSAFLSLPARMHSVFVAGALAVVARERIGDGDLILIAWPEIFQNGSLAEGDHLTFLVALAGKRPAYFDEVPHGIVSGDGALALMKDWNLGPFLAMLCGVAVLVFWRGGKRVGPPEDEHREVRSDSVDLVRSLAALYKKVTPPSDAIDLYHDALTRTVAHTSGLRGDALRKRVDDLTRGRRTLTSINEAFEKIQSVKGSKAQRRTDPSSSSSAALRL
jgi:hypothetical protein